MILRCYCPECNTELEYDDSLCGKKVFQCPECNAEFKMETTETAPQPSENEKLCQNCGKIIKKDELICQHCQSYQSYYCDCSCPECNAKMQVADTDLEKNVICPECSRTVVPICHESSQQCPHCQKIFFVKNDQDRKSVMRCPFCQRITIQPRSEVLPNARSRIDPLYESIPARIIQPQPRQISLRKSKIFACCFLTALLALACYAELPRQRHAFLETVNNMRNLSSFSAVFRSWQQLPDMLWHKAEYSLRRNIFFDGNLLLRDLSCAGGWVKTAAGPAGDQIGRVWAWSKSFFTQRPSNTSSLEDQIRQASEAYLYEDKSKPNFSGSDDSESNTHRSYFQENHYTERSYTRRNSYEGGGRATLNLDREKFRRYMRDNRPEREDPPPHREHRRRRRFPPPDHCNDN